VAGAKADIHVTQKIESAWKGRSATQISDIVWTYVGTRTGSERVSFLTF
jgi:hypothetical protein